MRFRPWIAALASVGLAIALYLTVQHYQQGVPLACPTSGIIDCNSVLTSPYAAPAGVPVSLLGVVWFAVALALAWRGSGWLRHWTWVGAAAVVLLVYTELFLVNAICLWCTAVHVLVLSILALNEWAVSTRTR